MESWTDMSVAGLNVRAASVDSGRVRRYLMMVAVLCAGCEPLESPERALAGDPHGIPLHGLADTPPCTEGVIWNVMRRAISDWKAHLDELARHDLPSAREAAAAG